MAILPVSTSFNTYRSVKKANAPKQQTSFGHRTLCAEFISQYPLVKADVYYPKKAVVGYTCKDEDCNEVHLKYNNETGRLEGVRFIEDGYDNHILPVYKYEDVEDQDYLEKLHKKCIEKAAEHFRTSEMRVRLDNPINIG